MTAVAGHGCKTQSSKTRPPWRKFLIFDSLGDWFATPNARGCAFVNATVELADPEPPAGKAVLDHRHRTREWIAELVAARGVSDPKFVARQIVQLMEGAVVRIRSEHLDALPIWSDHMWRSFGFEYDGRYLVFQ
ncbi:TetR family transcriptional regulator C-terminal domain-containing protein [Rhodococcus sp. MSC1_016]|uniref:TetR family transcriptional regulator C-terminal domain-containing protein n=1 Tax=Rhodococcus sp. MSC1_016 TaxID=2909266 RepID=UPI0035B20FB0